MENSVNITDLGKQIIKIREEEGLTYAKIAERLKCSKSTVSYWCNPKSRETSKNRKDRLKKENPGIYKFQKAVTFFKGRKENTVKQGICKDWRKKFRESITKFKNRKDIMVEYDYDYKDALEVVGGINTKCYLTGRSINIEKDNFALDHKIPVSKGGTNELSNIGITIPEANASKSSMTIEEYINLCKEVLENFGYKITKNE